MKRMTTLLAALALVFGLSASAQAYIFETLDPPGVDLTVPGGINDLGDVVGYYSDSSGGTHGFVYDGSTYTTLDYPDSIGTGAYMASTIWATSREHTPQALTRALLLEIPAQMKMKKMGDSALLPRQPMEATWILMSKS